jgi:translocation-and-assembly-module (TAM) inner membrane subunit TamB-like protein
MKQLPRSYKIAILAFVLVGAGLLTLSKTGPGQRLLFNVVTGAFSSNTGYTLTAQETGGTWPWHITLKNLEISKDRRTALKVSVLDLRWSPLSVVKGPMKIKSFLAGTIDIHTGSFEDGGTDLKTFRLPSLDDLPSLRLAEFEIASLSLIDAEGQSSAPYVIFGTSTTGPGRAEVTASLLAHDATEAKDQISIDLDYSQASDLFSLESDILLAKDGFLSWLGQKRFPLPIRINTEGAQKASEWESRAAFSIGGMASGDVTVRCDCLAGRNLIISGSVEPKGLDLSVLPFSTTGQIKFAVTPVHSAAAKKIAFKNLTLETSGAQLYADLELSYARKTYTLGGETRMTTRDGPISDNNLGTVFLSFEDLEMAEKGWAIRSARLETLKGYVTAKNAHFEDGGAANVDLSGTLDPKEIFQRSDPLGALSPLNWSSNFSYSSGGKWVAQSFTARTSDGELNLSGTAEYSSGSQTLVANVEGHTDDLLVLPNFQFPAKSAFIGTLNLDHSEVGSYIDLKASLDAFTFSDFQAPPTLLQADIKNWRSLDPAAIKGTLSLVATGPSSDLSSFSSRVSFAPEGSLCLIEADLLAAGQYAARLNICATSPKSKAWKTNLTAKSFHGGPFAGRTLTLDAAKEVGGFWTSTLIGQDLTYNAIKLQEVGASASLEDSIEGLQVVLTSARALHQDTEYQIKERTVVDLKSGLPDHLVIASDNGGWASLTTAKTDDTFTASLDAKDFKVPLAPALLSGTARLNYGAEQQSADIAVFLSPLSALQQPEPSQTARFGLTGKWDGLDLSGDIDMALSEGSIHSDVTRIGEFTLPFEVDLGRSTRPFSKGPIAASLHYEGAVDHILALLPIYDHSAGGRLSVAASLTSEGSTSKWQGHMALTDATYTYKTQNLFIEGLSVNADLNGTGSALRSNITIRQHEEGRNKPTLKGDGTFVFQTMDKWEGILDIVLDKNKLLQHENYQGILSGKLNGVITPSRASLKGDIRADRIDGSIPAPSSNKIVKLNVIRVDDQGHPIEHPKPRGGRSFIPPLDLDIILKANEQLFVRGRGLDTEWGGKIKLTGTSGRPILVGALELKRGQLMFGGRAFDIDTGTIAMSGRDYSDPYIDLSASNKIGATIQAKIVVEGRASAPKVRFESTPAMPEEDIVAYILFGKPVIELGALEAIRTAVAIAQISGRAGFGTSLADRARQAIGVDVLQFTPPTGADGEASVLTIGKYLTSDIFLSVSEDFETQIGSAGVEVKVTDSISVGAKMDETAETEASIEWSKDY